MIVIKKNKTNKIALTLTERVELTTPFFLFRFIEQQTNKEYPFIAMDESDYPDRFNMFVISEVDKNFEDKQNGFVNLPIGNYYYEIYEQDSSANFDYKNSSKKLEDGKVRVRDKEEETKVYDEQENENIAYDETQI